MTKVVFPILLASNFVTMIRIYDTSGHIISINSFDLIGDNPDFATLRLPINMSTHAETDNCDCCKAFLAFLINPRDPGPWYLRVDERMPQLIDRPNYPKERQPGDMELVLSPETDLAIFRHSGTGEETILKLHTLPLNSELLERELARSLNSEDYTKCALIHSARERPDSDR